MIKVASTVKSDSGDTLGDSTLCDSLSYDSRSLDSALALAQPAASSLSFEAAAARVTALTSSMTCT